MFPVTGDYETSIGVVFIGGCGINSGRHLIDKIDPAKFPGLKLFLTNTDLKALKKQFQRPNDERLERWDPRRITIHHLGGMEVTRGRGAGFNPKIGRQAAEWPTSQEAIKQFLESVDQVVLRCGLGKGTGAGATPVIAKMAVELGKPTIALVTMPDPEEGRPTEATSAVLAEIQGLVPTIALSNAFLSELVKKMTVEECMKFDFTTAWRYIDENVSLPMLVDILDTMQDTGDDINFDDADWGTLIKGNKHIFHGRYSVSKANITEARPRHVVGTILAGEFQNREIITSARGIALWIRGPWNYSQLSEISDLIKEVVSGKDRLIRDGLEVHKGIVSAIEGDEASITLILLADKLRQVEVRIEDIVGENEDALSLYPETPTPLTLPESKIVREPAIAPVPTPEPVPAPVAAMAKPSVPAAVKRPQVRPALDLIEFPLDGGGRGRRTVNAEFAKYFNQTYRNIAASREEMDLLIKETEEKTGLKPALPERYAPPPTEDKGGWGFGNIFKSAPSNFSR